MILVTGGAGVMGARLVRGLAGAGHKVRVLTLPGDPYVSRLDGTGCEIVYGDVANEGTLGGLFDGVTTVYHLAAVIIAHDPKIFERINVGGVRNMLDGAVRAGVEHFIYVSSASVIDPAASDYAASKAEGEKMVKAQSAMHYTIIRPTLVYEKDGGQEFMMFMDYLKKYPVVPFVGSGRGRKNPVLADDVVKGLLAVAGNPRSYGKTYNFSGGEVITMRDLARLMLRHQGIRKPIIHLPLPLCYLLAALMEKTMPHPPLTRYAVGRVDQDADLDNSEALQDLGYAPVGVTEGLQLCWPLPRRNRS